MKHLTGFFFFIFALAINLVPHQNVDASLVEVACQRSHHMQNCIASLESNPDSKNATLPQLAIIALKIANENATAISLYINKLLNNTNLDPAIEQALSDCSDQYVDANQQLVDSVASSLSNATQDVYNFVGAAIADAKTCENGFPKTPGRESLLTSRNAVFRQLCNNALAINKLLNGLLKKKGLKH